MIIKKVRIKSFGGIKDREFDFKRGASLINGKDEKKAIENFIKIWLYGFEDSESSIRKEFISSLEDKMQGQLIIEYKGAEYVIQRTFGLDKKDDELIIYDRLTGREINFKEREEILNHIKKLKLLEEKEKEINNYLEKNRDIITKEFVNYLVKENKTYLKILHIKKENEFDLREIKNKIICENNKLDNYKFFSSMDEDFKDNLINLSNEQEKLSDKVLLSRKMKFSLEEEERTLEEKRRLIGETFKLTSYKEEIKTLIQDYKNKQKELKERIESSNIDKNIENLSMLEKIKDNKFILLSILGGLIFIINMIGIHVFILYLLSIVLILVGIFFVMRLDNKRDIKSESVDDKNIDYFNKEIKQIEQKLQRYMKLINCDSYESLLKSITDLENFYLLEAKIKLKIEENNIKLQNMPHVYEDEKKYKDNKKVIDSMLKLCGCNTIEEMYIKLEEFEKINNNLDRLYLEYNSKREVLKKISIELKEKESEIKNNLRIINLEYIDLIDLEIYLERFRKIL